MPTVGIIRKSAYFDSVALMLAQREARALPGVEEVGVVMGTDANKALLRASSLDFDGLTQAGPDDLIVVARAAERGGASSALARAQEALTRPRPAASAGTYRPKTVASAARDLPGASLALVSVPGRFARSVALEALEARLHVLLFSDNVPLEHEIELKARARTSGLLVMGPDCGTAIIGGAALGFANRIRPGRIGLVGAAGTGMQEIATLIHRFGGGITHAIGTGSRDRAASVGGATMLQGLRALALDALTEVIVIVSKPPSPDVAGAMLAAARGCGKPVIAAFVGARIDETGSLHGASSLDEAARLAVRMAYGIEVAEETLRALPAQEAGRLGPAQRFLRALYSGGTLAAEAQVLLRPRLGRIWSNAPLDPAETLDPSTHSREHSVIDLGSDEFTQGRLHPMLDPTLRLQRLRQEADDPDVAVILLDVVLGYGAHPDPAGALAPAIREARDRALAAGRYLAVVGSVCGTDDDPQGAVEQRATLIEAGMLVEDSNARAARLAGLIVEGRTGTAEDPGRARPAGRRGAGSEAPHLVPASVAPEWPDVVPILALLRDGPVVVNVGLELFEESLRAQGVPVASVDWRPPAGGKAHLLDLLDKLDA